VVLDVNLLSAEGLEKLIFYQIIRTMYDINSGKYYIMSHYGLSISNDDDDDDDDGSGNNSIQFLFISVKT
jgi:hypothetical protein